MSGGERKRDMQYGLCRDCGADTRMPGADHYYSVHDHIWQQSGLPALGGMLCIPCLEQRIGRVLRAADFADVLINRPGGWHSDILNQRLTGI
jgi:hypothetical protein